VTDVISSSRNERIKAVRKLHDPRARKLAGKTLIEGSHLLVVALAAGVEPEAIYVAEGTEDEWEQSPSGGAPVLVVTNDVLGAISTTQHPRGPLAVVKVPAPESLRSVPTVVLWEVADPGNCGTLIRTAAALDWNVAFVGGVDPWNPKVLRAGAGGHFATGLSTLESAPLAELRGAGLAPMAMVAAGGVAPEVIDSTAPIALIVGNEASGLDPKVIAECDATLSLPMPGGMESLNASVAGAIAMYALRESE
jgi:TrmH family RNA methyltransferase